MKARDHVVATAPGGMQVDGREHDDALRQLCELAQSTRGFGGAVASLRVFRPKKAPSWTSPPISCASKGAEDQ